MNKENITKEQAVEAVRYLADTGWIDWGRAKRMHPTPITHRIEG